MRMPKIYVARFMRLDQSDPRRLPARQFTVEGWNKLDADAAAVRALEAAGEDPRAWWYVGADRRTS